MTQEQEPILDSYWVVTGRFRAGEYPGSTQDEEARKKLRWLLAQGTSFVLDLTEEGEQGLEPYVHLLQEEADKMDKQVLHTRIPIQDFSTPSQEAMANILDVIDGAIADGKKIYLHCKGGLGRTGMTVGCYLVRHGLPVSDVLDVIYQLRKDTPHKGSQSPETEAQIRIVMKWKKGQ